MNAESSTPPRWWEALAVTLLCLATLLMIVRTVGCGTASNNTPEAISTDRTGQPALGNSDPAAKQILQQMIDHYRQAQAYRDEGQLQLRFVRNGRRVDQSWPTAIHYVRSGKLRADVFNLHLVSDSSVGKRGFVARVDDADSNNIDQQVVVHQAPRTITLDALAADPLLYAQVTGRLQRPPAQLELLLSPDALATLFTKGVDLRSLPAAAIDDHDCARIAAVAAEGTFTFWIDKRSFVLRRLEYPAKALLADLATDPLVSEATLIANFVGATFKPEDDAQDFRLAIPAQSHQVRAFVLPPTTGYSDLLGKTLPSYEFSLLGGKKIDAAALDGKVTALLWYAHHPVCKEPMQEFVHLVEKLDSSALAYAVCTEPADVGDKAVRDQLNAWGVKSTPARDLKEYRSSVFHVSNLPSITLMDGQGRLQWLASGPVAMAEFPKAMQRLLKGDDLAAESLEKEKLLREEYQRLVSVGGPPIDEGLASAYPASKLQLKQAWQISDLPSAAGVIAVNRAMKQDRIFAVVAGRTVDEFDFGGTIKGSHALQLPDAVTITCLRSFTDKQGKTIFAAFAPTKPGVYVFDDAWQPRFVYPAQETEALDLRDVQFSDLDADGEPELLIAFTESAGLHCVSSTGERQWANRAYVPLLSIAPQRRVVYVTGRGGVMRINSHGQEDLQRDVDRWVLSHLFAPTFNDAIQASFLGIGTNSLQEPCMVGISSSLGEAWNVPLSGSLFTQPIDFVASAKLRPGAAGDWVVAWGDGVVHVVSEDGEFADSFGTGKAIRGIVIAQQNEESLLLIAGDHDLTAWKVAAPPMATPVKTGK